MVGAAGLANGSGSWQVAADGGVFACGSAGYFGSVPGLGIHAAQPVVGMAATSDGRGYWLVAADGGVFAFGDAHYLGGAASLRLNSPIVGIVADGADDGYWLVAADGGVFAYGHAAFGGSMGGRALNAPIVGAASAGGQGYWLVAADGGVFTFGGAPFFGSAGSIALSAPASGITVAPGGLGYWIVAQDGGVFAYGSARFDPSVHPMFGTPVGAAPVNPVIDLLPGAGVGSYTLIGAVPGVEPGVTGRTGFDLASREFDLDQLSSGQSAYAIEAGLVQAAQYLLIDGSANGASAEEVAACVDELSQLATDVAALSTGRDTPTIASVVALAAQITAFFGLGMNPYQVLVDG